MGVTTTKTNKPLNPRAQDQSPLAFNRAKLYSGKALDFDGVNDEVNCGDINVAFSEISFAFHFNADSFSNNCIFQKESVFRFIGVNTNQIDIVLATTGNSWYSKKMTLNNIESKDYFLVATYNGSELKAYLNGVLVDTLGGYSGSVTSVSQNVYVGRTNGGLYYNGKVSGARIFNTALTAAQVADLYNNPEKVVPTGVDNTALKLWLPMMEGAGTTAYDGSGNGNHGTISGATYVNGVGAPVSQSAVIDWNKGINSFTYSEDFSNANWITIDVTKVSTSETDYIGGNTAANITWLAGSPRYFYQNIGVSGASTLSFYVKSNGGGNKFRLFGNATSVVSSDFTATNEWVRYSYNFTGNGANGIGIIQASDNSAADLLVCFAQVETNASVGPYTPTLSTAQTSPVLLPQGLTTGRDITGVNLFENVRKQGALNLDGNSWAEVHDNGSLDFGTGSFTLEAWAKATYLNQGSGLNTILSLGGSSSGGNTMSLNIDSGLLPIIYYNGFYSVDSSAQTAGDWFHIVGTYDETNRTIYVNGVQVDQDAQTAVSITNALVKQIGRDTNANRLYQDQIAQPRIYNRALTAEEVQRSYDSGKNIYTNS